MAGNSVTTPVDVPAGPNIPQPAVLAETTTVNCPIHDLPTELLCKVFRLLHAELSKSHDPTNYTLLPAHIQQVCKRWYDIVTNYAPLWGTIHFHDFNFDRVGMIAAYVAHAQKLSVDGAYEVNDQMLPFKEILGSFGEEVLPRLHELWIPFDGMTEVAEKQLNLMKDLETLYLVFGDILPEREVLQTYRIELPALRHFSARNIDNLEWSSCIFNRLESIRLQEDTPVPNETIHKWTKALSQFPLLRDVTFDLDNSMVVFDPDEFTDEAPRPHSSPSITLNFLRSLTLRSIKPYHLEHVFSSVEMPNLRSLKLSASYWPRPDEEDWSFFNKFRSCWRLETLSLRDWVQTEELLTRIVTSSKSSASLLHLALHRYSDEPHEIAFEIPVDLLSALHTVHSDSMLEAVALRLAFNTVKKVVLPLEATGLPRGCSRSTFAQHTKWLKWLRRKVELRIESESGFIPNNHYKSWRHMMRQRPLQTPHWQG